MDNLGPEQTFHGLPLTSEQEAEVQHYLHTRKRRGLPCDTQALNAMLADMLDPPPADDRDDNAGAEGVLADADRASAMADDALDPISAAEERIAAREAEAMKRAED